MTHEEKALSYFKDKFHCSQSVLAAYADDLLGCDISTKEGVRHAMEHNCFTEVCPKMVASAVKILESMEE